MAMTRLSDPTPRMTLPRALLSEALRLARSPLTAVHLVCGLAAGLACGEYFSVTRWDPTLGADAYAQFLGALMPLMSAIVCGLAVDEERAAGRLANLTAVPSRGRAVAAKLLALAALGAGALAVALGVFGAVLAVAGRLPLGPAPLAAAWAGIVLGSLPLYALGLGVALRLGRNAAIGAGAAGMLLAFFSVGGLAHGLMTGELTGALATPLSWVPLAWPARLGSLGVEAFIDAARAAGPLLTTALAGLVLALAAAAVLVLLSAALVLGGNALLDAGWGSALRAGLWTAERGASTMPTGVSGGRTWRGYWQWMMSGRSSTRSRASSAATAMRSSRQRTRRRSRGWTSRASTSCSATS